VVAAVAMTAARIAFFFHVREFATRGHFAVPADHASAAQRRETKQSNETDDALRF